MFYHAVNRGIEKKTVFMDKKDLDRFAALLDYYRFKNPETRFSFRKRSAYSDKDAKKSLLVEVLAFCLMPDRFHILLKEIYPRSVSKFLSLVSNSYTKYFNARYKRSGPLFAGTFRSIPIGEDTITNVSRHIHLSPVLSNIVLDLRRFPFSSFPEYLGLTDGFCEKKYILGNFQNPSDYHDFVMNKEDYQSTKQSLSKFYLE